MSVVPCLLFLFVIAIHSLSLYYIIYKKSFMWQTASRIVKPVIVDTFISVYIVSQCAFYGTLGINGLKEQVIMSTDKQH